MKTSLKKEVFLIFILFLKNSLLGIKTILFCHLPIQVAFSIPLAGLLLYCLGLDILIISLIN